MASTGGVIDIEEIEKQWESGIKLLKVMIGKDHQTGTDS